MEIKYEKPPPAAVRSLYDAVGWSNYTEQTDKLDEAIERSTWMVAAWTVAMQRKGRTIAENKGKRMITSLYTCSVH